MFKICFSSGVHRDEEEGKGGGGGGGGVALIKTEDEAFNFSGL